MGRARGATSFVRQQHVRRLVPYVLRHVGGTLIKRVRSVLACVAVRARGKRAKWTSKDRSGLGGVSRDEALTLFDCERCVPHGWGFGAAMGGPVPTVNVTYKIKLF